MSQSSMELRVSAEPAGRDAFYNVMAQSSMELWLLLYCGARRTNSLNKIVTTFAVRRELRKKKCGLRLASAARAALEGEPNAVTNHSWNTHTQGLRVPAFFIWNMIKRPLL